MEVYSDLLKCSIINELEKLCFFLADSDWTAQNQGQGGTFNASTARGRTWPQRSPGFSRVLLGSPGFPGGSPGLPLAVDQQVVEQEEDSLLDVSGGDLQQVAVEKQLRGDVRQVGPLWMTEPQSDTGHFSGGRLMGVPPAGILTTWGCVS